MCSGFAPCCHPYPSPCSWWSSSRQWHCHRWKSAMSTRWMHVSVFSHLFLFFQCFLFACSATSSLYMGCTNDIPTKCLLVAAGFWGLFWSLCSGETVSFFFFFNIPGFFSVEGDCFPELMLVSPRFMTRHPCGEAEPGKTAYAGD